MVEIDPVLAAIVIAQIGLVGSVTVAVLNSMAKNGHKAREFERQKREYDEKLKRYSVVGDCLQLLELWCLATNSCNSLFKMLEEAKKGRIGHRSRIHNALFSFLNHLKVLKLSVALPVEEYSELVTGSSYLGVEWKEIRQGREVDKAFNRLNERALVLSECRDIVLMKLRRATSNIRIIGGLKLAQGLEELMIDPSLVDIHDLRPADWKKMIDSITNDLAVDLALTL